MPSTTKLFLGVRGTRQGAASPGRPRQKALSRPLVHPSTRHPRDLGLLGLNVALLCLIGGQRLATGSGTGATGLRPSGNETLGVPCTPCNSPAADLPRYLPTSPSPLWRLQRIVWIWEAQRASHAHGREADLARISSPFPSSGSPAPQLQQPPPGSYPQSILTVSSLLPALTPRKHHDPKNRGRPDSSSR